jgi:hypothetical protein
MKTFTIAGYSNLNGRVKLRVATGSMARRLAVLKSAGHTDINLVELPEPMTREIAAAYIAREFAGVSLFKPKVTAPESVSQEQELLVEFTPESVDA